MASVTGAAISGTKWVAFSQASRLVAQLLSVVILARLLPPSDFGLVTMAAVITGFAGLFRDFGTMAAVIQRSELSDGLLDSVFWLNVSIGAGIGLLLVALAPMIALGMHEARLADVLWLLALAFPVASLGLVQQALLERSSRFRPVALIESLSAFAGLGIAVSAAMAGWGVYSLVSQSIATAILATAGFWTVSNWRPGKQGSFTQIRELAGFSGNLVGYNIFNYFARNLDSLLIGRFLGSTELGYYNMAYRLMLWPLQNISGVVGRALFPALSRIQDDRQRLAQGYIRATAAVFLVTAPLTLGLFVLREPFVAVALGAGWRKVSDLLFWLAPVGLLQSVVTTVGPLYLALGRTDVMFKWGVFAGSVAICAFAIGLKWGIEGVAAAYFAASLVLFWPSLAVPLRLIKTNVTSVLRRLAPALFAAALMALLVALGAEHSSEVAMPGWVRLTVLAAWGAGSYLVLSLFIQRTVLKDLTRALSGR